MRSLGVIFLSDVVGYSKMMTDDETGTLNLIREFQKDIIKPTLAKYQGNMIKSLGDGWLIEFKSASNAVNCAALMFPDCCWKLFKNTSLPINSPAAAALLSACAIVFS